MKKEERNKTPASITEVSAISRGSNWAVSVITGLEALSAAKLYAPVQVTKKTTNLRSKSADNYKH